MRRRSAARLDVALGIALAFVVAGLSGCHSSRPAQDPPPVPVSIAVATRGPAANDLAGLGHVQGLVTSLARAQTSGQLTSVSFVEGANVRQGQALAQIDPRPLQAVVAQDEAALARDRAALANALDNVRRTAPLVAQGLASEQQVEGYKSQAAQFAAAVAGDRATIRRDRLTLAYTTIRAPISGVTGVRQIDPGNVVGPTDPAGLVTIVQVQPIAITFTLPQTAIGPLRAAMAKGGAAGVRVDALTHSGGQMLDRGRLSVINNQVDTGSGTVTLKAIFPNASNQLWPGQMLTARVTLAIDADAVRVPASAIQSNPQGSYVWLLDQAGKAAMRPVAIGRRIGDAVVITRGLSGGERVVTDGQFGLSPGARVFVASTPASQPMKADAPDQLGLQP